MKFTAFRHMLAHWLSLNAGKCVTKTDEDGFIWVAFECKNCGKIQGKMRLENHILMKNRN